MQPEWKKIGMLSKLNRKDWRRLEDTIKKYHKEIVASTRNWIDSTQDRDYGGALVNATVNIRVP